jgi:hypothetical protein
MSLFDVASEVAVPAMRAVFNHGDVTSFELSILDDQPGTVGLSVTVRGETFDYPVIQGDACPPAAPTGPTRAAAAAGCTLTGLMAWRPRPPSGGAHGGKTQSSGGISGHVASGRRAGWMHASARRPTRRLA